MAHILIGGVVDDLHNWLSQRFTDMSVTTAKNGREVLEELSRGDVALLILDDRVCCPNPMEVLYEARSVLGLADLRVFYCMDPGLGCDLPRKLVSQYRVNQVLFHPLDREELARQVAGILGLALRPLAQGEPAPEERLLAGVAGVWDRFAATTIERVDILEKAGVALLEGNLTPELRQGAEREAHKLAGSLGTFGFAAGSRFARELEHMLQGGALLSEKEALRFSELVVALRLDLERAPTARGSGSEAYEHFVGDATRHSLLIADKDAELAERLALEAVGRSIRVRTATNFLAAREVIAADAPDAVLLDVALSGGPEEGMALVTELAARTPPLPVMVLTSKDTFTDRVEAARRGGHGFLSKALSPSQILEAVTQLLSRLRVTEAKVMAVDDDPQVLAVLESLLAARNVRFTGLADPLRFWQTLEESSPDLLVLDVDMPHLTGVELCRIVRNDPRWAGLPVLFLTAHADADTVHRVFSAGADDFVSKPIVGPELLTRIFNRLERSQLHRSVAEVDPLTGVANRRKSARDLEQFLRLAQRYGQPLCLALIDLDRVPEVNSQHGHAAGDAVLRRLGQLLEKSFQSEDVVGRWGGDEFIVGMHGLNRPDGVQRLAEVLEDFRDDQFRGAAGSEFHAAFSAAVAEYPEDGTNLQALYRVAEETVRQAKAAGGDRVLPVGWNPESREKLKNVDVALVMEDEAEASLLLHSLETRGYRARWLRDGKSAAKALAGMHPSLRAKVTLLDENLRGLDGLEVLRRLAWDGVLERSRVIMLTVPSVDNAVAAAVELGAFAHVAKPFSPPVLMSHIRRALEAGGSGRLDAGLRGRR